MSYAVIFAFLFVGTCCAEMHVSNDDAALVLVPHGENPDTSLNKVIIPHIEKGGPLPPLPCVVAGSGTHEHGQTFLKHNFHYKCNNGTAEVIACVSEDMSVIQINRTFLRNGIRHKCLISGETVTYEQRSTCFENGIHYDIGDSFRNGSFKIICKENGPVIEGCYIQNRESDIVLLGESIIIGKQKHSCEVMPYGKIRYTINALGCRKGEEIYSEGQIWTDKHIRYQCVESGVTRVLGCIDEGGLFIELGRDLLMQGIVHRCYKVNNTTFYHRFQCEERSLHDCLINAPTPRRVRNIYNRKI
uniref:Abnormal cell migration protein 18-like fibronectin type I domain-containing protein n=1 Tax=Panagrolaimus superbus TaxID=310955 RepID=A0A914YI72_9BILA